MARWENEDVSNLNLPDKEETEIEYYDKYGNTAQEKVAVVKVTHTKQGDKTIGKRYYVKFFRGELVDPHSIDYNKKTKMFTFKKVSEKTYNQYMKYLKTKNTLYFTRSRRLSREN